MLELGLDAGVEVLEALATVSDHGATERLEGLGADFDGAGDVEFDVSHKAEATFSKGTSGGKR